MYPYACRLSYLPILIIKLQVAVKRILASAAGRRSFHRELSALSAVRHQNVLRVLAYNEHGDPDGAQYLVTTQQYADR